MTSFLRNTDLNEVNLAVQRQHSYVRRKETAIILENDTCYFLVNCAHSESRSDSNCYETRMVYVKSNSKQMQFMT